MVFGRHMGPFPTAKCWNPCAALCVVRLTGPPAPAAVRLGHGSTFLIQDDVGGGVRGLPGRPAGGCPGRCARA